VKIDFTNSLVSAGPTKLSPIVSGAIVSCCRGHRHTLLVEDFYAEL